MTTLEIAIWACLAVGLFFNALGVIGILRFPDVYTRLHADTKATTFGSIFLGAAVITHAIAAFVNGSGDGASQHITHAIHAGLAVIVLAFTNATGAHAIARAAHRSGIGPQRSVVDRLAEKAKQK